MNGEKLMDEITSPTNTIRDIHTDHLIYQLNSSSDAKKTVDKLRKDIDSVSQAMIKARKIAYEKKAMADELRIILVEKRDSVKKARSELEHSKANVVLASRKALEIETETNKVKRAIEKIKESTLELDQKYFEKAQSDLMTTLIRLISETEKAQSSLKAARELETLTATKLYDVENELSKFEIQTDEKINESERIVSNVSMTISHIVRSYDEVTNVAIDLLKSSTSTYNEIRQESSSYNETREENQVSEIAI